MAATYDPATSTASRPLSPNRSVG